MTLCLITQGDRVLLGMKKRGFGAGWWNGFGGKVHDDETLEDAVQRELEEEAGIRASDPIKRAIITFGFRGDNEVIDMHVYSAQRFTGEPKESEEMKPQWFPLSAMPFESMWPDDRHWMPAFFSGKRLRGYFLFDAGKKIIHHEVHELSVDIPL